MKNVLSILFCLFLFYLPAKAEEGNKEEKESLTIEIIVIDAETEEPLPAAKIKIGQKEVEAYTDFDGFAQLKPLESGVYDIEISSISYQKHHLKDFKLDNTTNKLLVKLQP